FDLTVYEKIALQNAADAAAYSLATQSARSFNFIAFTNRTLIAKQIELLELHAEASQLTYSVGFTGYLGDLAQTYATALPEPTTQAALRTAGEALEGYHKGLEGMLEGKLTTLETALAAEPAFSNLYSAMAASLVASTTARLIEGAPDIAADNDVRAELHPLSNAFNAYNVFAYLDAFEPGAIQKDTESQRAFAEVVNASRFAAGSQQKKLVWRDGVMAELADSLGAIDALVGESGNNISGVGDQLSELTGFAGLDFQGTSKLLTRTADFAELEDTGSAADERSYLARGDVMVSKDLRAGLPPLTALARAAEEGWASLQSATDGYRHCRYEKPAAYGTGGLARALRILADPDAAGFACTSDAEHNLRWRGIGRYFRFKPKSSAAWAGARPHNQPDVWVFLTKPPKDDALDFEIDHGSETVSFDSAVGANGLLGTDVLKGVNAIARAQVYYHRPGAWREPPNFFNPFWGARLAPKSAVTDQLLSRLGLEGVVSDFFSDNTMMF
ncbi:MAG: hypothetical protein AAFX94_03370, partial [Myxococcota bacterium]